MSSSTELKENTYYHSSRLLKSKNNLKNENKKLKKRMRELLEANRQLQKELEEKQICEKPCKRETEDILEGIRNVESDFVSDLYDQDYLTMTYDKPSSDIAFATIYIHKIEPPEESESEDEEESESDSESEKWSDKRCWMVHVNDYKEFFNKKYKNVNDEEWVEIYVRQHWWENGNMFDIKWEGDEDGEMECISNSSGFAAKMEEWVDEDDDEDEDV